MLLSPITGSVRVNLLTTSNVDISTELAAGQTVDGVVLAVGYLVVLAGQTDPTQNGIYDVPRAGTAPRHSDFREYANLVGMSINVMQGGDNADTNWIVSSNQGGVLGTDAVTIVRESVGGISDVAGLQAALDAKATITFTTVTAMSDIGNDINTSGKSLSNVYFDESFRAYIPKAALAASAWHPLDMGSTDIEDITPT